MRLVLMMIATAALAACASSTPYEPAGQESKYGFTEQKIEDNRYRIMFKGNSLTDRETVENYILYRAAEITLENGFDYFVVVEDDTEKDTSYTSTNNNMFFYGRGRPFPYYGYGYRWDPFYDSYDVIERKRYTAMAYILMGRGDKPTDTVAAYDAQQVKTNLESAIVRPDTTK